MKRSQFRLFIERHPSVCVYTLIQVAEHINRSTKAHIGYEGIIQKALEADSGQYLAEVCLSLQKDS